MRSTALAAAFMAGVVAVTNAQSQANSAGMLTSHLLPVLAPPLT
jgi:hypothetical protein